MRDAVAMGEVWSIHPGIYVGTISRRIRMGLVERVATIGSGHPIGLDLESEGEGERKRKRRERQSSSTISRKG